MSYTRQELIEIANGVEQYMREGKLDYFFTSCSGTLVHGTGKLSDHKHKLLFQMIKDLHLRYGSNT